MRRNTSTGIAVALAVAAVSSGCAHVFLPVTAPVDTPCEGRARAGEWGTNAVSVLCAEDFEGTPAFQVEEWVEGRVPGVWVVRRRGGLSLLIRGPTSILGDNEPLYVLDGMPLVLEPGRGLHWLSPGGIQMIEVLKDAGATALYGMRGANGVVLITSRR